MKPIYLLVTALLLFSCQKQSLTDNRSDEELRIKKTETCFTDPAALTQVSVITTSAKKIKNPPTTGNYSCIYLDFAGHTVTSAHWNNGTTFECAPAALTTTQIEYVLDKVRNAFAPYKVVITENESEYLNANRNMRMRIIITPTSAWRPGVSGVAYINSITWGDGTPAFVFSDRLSNIEHFIGEIAAHEAGHTLGLYHQTVYDQNCNLINPFNPGKIMGNSLHAEYGEWTIGTSHSCTTIQNDNQVLKNKLGFR